MNSTNSSRRTGHISSQNNTRSFLMATKSVQLAKAHLTCLYIIDPVYKHLTLCELEKSLNHKKGKRKLSGDQKDLDIHAHDEYM